MENNSRYTDFILHNRKFMNASMSKILLVSSFAGPAIAFDKLMGYCSVSYIACIHIMFFLVIASFVQMILSKFKPLSMVTVVWGIFSFAIILTFMCTEKVAVYITYALIPIVSLFYCEKQIYLIGIFINFLMIIISNALISGYLITFRTDWNTSLDMFISVMFGYTIESIVIGIAGYFLCTHIIKNFRKIYDDELIIDKKTEDNIVKSKIVQTLSGHFVCVYLINFKMMTYETIMKDESIASLIRDGSIASNIERVIFAFVSSKYIDKTRQFMDIKTLPNRLKMNHVLNMNCFGKFHGMCKISIVASDVDSDGRVDSAIFTVQKYE